MNLTTRQSLLVRLGTAPDAADWEIFYAQYAGVILSFAQQRGLDADSARDVLQETMLVALRKLPEFRYDAERGRFRNWLLTIVTHKVRAAHRRTRAERHIPLDADSEEGGVLRDTLAADGGAPDAAIEGTWRQCLLEEALRCVLDDAQTDPQTVAIFRAYALEDRPAGEVAAHFGVKENAVYQIKNRLVARLRALVEELENGGAS